jgi:hypothetical protein
MTIQLIDSKPDGIRICHVEGESLVTVVIPREMLADAKQLPSIPKRGIYYLLDEDHGVISRVYAGQTTQGLRRLDTHKSKKEFWNKAIMFLDDEVNIDRDVLDVLEADAIEYIRSHGSYETDNSDTPSPYVSPYREQTVKRLHEGILFRMAALGYDLNRKETVSVRGDTLFHTKRNGIAAKGHYDKRSGAFTVLAGSQIDLSRPVLKNVGAESMRGRLFGNAAGVAELADDITFPSPSAAAVFTLGGSQNGWTEWVNNQGQTLNQIYRAKKD